MLSFMCVEPEIGIRSLTPAETEVLLLLGEGRNYREIASKRVCAETTVKTHVNNIFSKLQVKDRTQAALFAVEFKKELEENYVSYKTHLPVLQGYRTTNGGCLHAGGLGESMPEMQDNGGVTTRNGAATPTNAYEGRYTP